MQSETKTCQNCKESFTVEPEDFEFYKKIKVPPPTWCPRCRLQRRLAFYNLFSLYKRKCDLCGEDSVSIYPPDSSQKVYCHICWWSDRWDPFDYGRDYDFSRSFFEQLRELWHEVPALGLSIAPDTAQTSPYTNHVSNLKNCYLVFQADNTEDAAYGFYIIFSKSVLDASLVYSSERIFDSANCFKDHNGIGHRYQVLETIDSAFLQNCSNCQNCFASANLKNKKYVAFNKQYTKEDYTAFINQYDLGSYKVYKEVEALAHEHWKKYPPDPSPNKFSSDSAGNFIFESKNCKECYEVVNAEDAKYLLLIGVGPVRDSYDISSWGSNMSLAYECMNCGINVAQIKFSRESGLGVRNAEYVTEVTTSTNVFASASVKKGEYVIFNKRYQKEDYEKLRAKIIQHMNDVPYRDSLGREYRYGEFFPLDLSPFEYNLTLAQNFFPLTKEAAISKNFRWREPDSSNYQTTLNASDLPDHIQETPAGITKEIIKCEKCGRGFHVIESELKLRKSMHVPLARACPFCRINEKMNYWVENLMLNDRTCGKCGVSFKTHWSEARAPYILCKPCYSKGVA